jgi:hypothetical protein
MNNSWQPVKGAPNEILFLAGASPPRLGDHASRVWTLNNGDWVIFRYPNETQPDMYTIIKGPPR